MRVLHLSTQDNGGAGKACVRISSAIKNIGVDSKILVLHKNQSQADIIEYQQTAKEKVLNLIKKTLHRIKLFKIKIDKNETFSFEDTGFRIKSNSTYKEADIINLHWVSFFLDYKSFFNANKKNLVWTLHDMEPFGAGNHYTRNYKISSVETKILESKLRIFRKNKLNLTIVSPSNWLLNKSKESLLFKDFSHICIPNGIDSNLYKKYDNLLTRKELHIPENKKIILFVAESLQDKRKGFSYLINSLEKIESIFGESVLLCTVGSINEPLSGLKKFHHFGYINDESKIAKIYSCADIFVIPSTEDNLPNTMIESLLCGTPVVGFRVGGISETIEDGKNGILCTEINCEKLAETITLALRTNFNKDQIRQDAIAKYDSKITAQKYLELYKRISNPSKL